MTFNLESNEYIFQGNFGLEKESFRIYENGYISNTPHPFTSEHVSRDFCENQLEIITNVYPSIEKLYTGLREINDYVLNTLKSLDIPEYLWYFSNPPYFENEKSIPIAIFDKGSIHKQKYREYLSKKYGKRQMLYSGIHYNFSFSGDLLKSLWNVSMPYNEFKSKIYLHIAKELSRYSWLLVALTSASPVYDCSFIDDNFLGIDGFSGYASLRNSEKGYWNKFSIILDYSSLDKYVDSIQKYVDAGDISSIGECYTPIRLKPYGINSLENLKLGVDHIELRMFDINPLNSVGINIQDLYFTHYLIIYLMSLESRPFTELQQIQAIDNHKKSARFCLENVILNFDGLEISLISKANEILDNMILFFRNANTSTPIHNIEYQKEKLSNPYKRYSNQIYDIYKNDFIKKGVQLSKKYANKGDSQSCVNFSEQT